MRHLTGRVFLTFIAVMMLGFIPLTAQAGGGPQPFEVKLTALADVQITSPPTSDFMQVFDALSGPVDAEVFLPDPLTPDFGAVTTSDFTRYANHAYISGGSITSQSFAVSDSSARDRLTVAAPVGVVGTTRLELTYAVVGSLSGESRYELRSRHNVDAASDDVSTDAGFLQFQTPGDAGPIDTSFTMVYNDIPLGASWNMLTTVASVAPGGNTPGDADFTTTLTGVSLYVDNALVHAGVTGSSGAVYRVFGDLDGDGFVGIDDLNLVLGNWNQNVPPADPLADPSGDGFVGIDDLNTVLGNWNAGTPPTAGAVPEPGTAVLVGLTGLVLSCRRR